MVVTEYHLVRLELRKDALEMLDKVQPFIRENGLSQRDFVSDAIILAAHRIKYENGRLVVKK